MLIQGSCHGDFDDHDSMGFRGDLVTMGLGWVVNCPAVNAVCLARWCLDTDPKKIEKDPSIGLL